MATLRFKDPIIDIMNASLLSELFLDGKRFAIRFPKIKVFVCVWVGGCVCAGGTVGPKLKN